MYHGKTDLNSALIRDDPETKTRTYKPKKFHFEGGKQKGSVELAKTPVPVEQNKPI